MLSLISVAGCSGSTGGSEVEANGPLICQEEEIADEALFKAAVKEREMTFYTAHFEEAERKVAEDFTDLTGIDVEVVRLPGTQLNERILSEHGGGQLSADVVRQSDFVLNLDYLEQGIAVAHTIPEELEAKIPAEWKSPEPGAWYGMPTFMVPIYNTKEVSAEDAPTSWEDLTDPQWSGNIAMTYAGIGGSGWALAMFERQVLGEDYWENLAAQKPAILESSSNVTEEIIRGEYPVAINDLYTTTTSIVDGAPVATVFPEEGIPGYSYAMSLFADSPSPNAGELFMNWSNSGCGFASATEHFNAYSPRPNDPLPEDKNGEPLPPLEDLNVWVADAEDWKSLREQWVSEWNETFNYGG